MHSAPSSFREFRESCHIRDLLICVSIGKSGASRWQPKTPDDSVNAQPKEPSVVMWNGISKLDTFFFAGSCMAQRNSLSGRSPFCQLVEVKKRFICDDDFNKL